MKKLNEYTEVMNEFQRQVELKYGKNCGFAYDGPRNSQFWFGTDNAPRILFLLKETYGNTNVCQIMDSEDDRFYDSPTNQNVSKVAHSIHSIFSQLHESKSVPANDEEMFALLDPIYDARSSVSKSELKQAYQKLAIVEVKKVSGDPISDNSDIRNHSRSFKSLLKKQIEILNPDIIICGGRITFESIVEDLQILKVQDLKSSGAGLYSNGNQLFYNSTHPSLVGFNYYDCLFDLIRAKFPAEVKAA